jgi:hypothetical protein
MWGGWVSFLTSFRDLGWLKLKEYENLKHYEDAGDAGFRCLHEEFCIVTENPEFIHMDAQDRPHCDDGPSHRWRDGWSLYHVHGVRVPDFVIMRPHEITPAIIKAEDNQEVRRVMIDRYGPQRYLHETKAELIDADVWQGLPRGLFEDQHGDRYLYGSDNSTGRIYSMPVEAECKTCAQAHENICGFSESLIQHQS